MNRPSMKKWVRGKWLVVGLLAVVWLVGLAVGLPVPTPLDVVATPIRNWPTFVTEPTPEEAVPTQLAVAEPLTLAAEPSLSKEDLARPTAEPEPTAPPLTESEARQADTQPEEATALIGFGSDDVAEEKEAAQPSDTEEPSPTPPSRAERLLSVVAAGQRLIEGDARVPTIGAEYTLEAIKEYIRNGWFYVLALVDNGMGSAPTVYAFRPDPAEPLRRGEFTLADSTFVATQISQVGLPITLSLLEEVFRLQVGAHEATSIRVRARTDVARYILAKQYGAMLDLGFAAGQIERARLYTDGVLRVGRNRPVYLITKVQVGDEIRSWSDPEARSP